MKNKGVCILAVLCVISISVMIFALNKSAERTTTSADSSQSEFIPPKFDENAESGTPETDDENYTQVYQDGMSFSAHVCGTFAVEDNSAVVWFTNDDGNEVWLKLRVLDSDGNTIAQTGLLKPNEYVKSISFDSGYVPQAGESITLKIMAYEPDTYYSAGAVSLNTTIANGG